VILRRRDEKGGAQANELASLDLGEPGEEPLNESEPKAKDEFSELTPNPSYPRQ